MGTVVMDRLLPEDSVIGSWDAGVVGYFSHFPVVNLDGLANSYDYMRARVEGIQTTFWRRYGITHFANGEYVKRRLRSKLLDDRLILFEGPSHPGLSGEFRFRLWSHEPPPGALQSGFDRSERLWLRMTQHFDYVSESVAVFVDGGMVQVFTKDCTPAEIHGQILMLSWSTDEGETVSRIWRPWVDARENSLGFCASAFELPNNVHPPVLIEVSQVDSVTIHGGDRLYPGGPGC